MFTYTGWPFRPLHARSIEETAVWWADCYLPNSVETILAGQPHWSILTGPSSCGKSVALAALEQRETAAFLVSYPPDHWPHAPHPWVREGNHLAQIMISAGLALRNHLSLNPLKITALSTLQQEFLRWLLEKSGGSRAFLRWADSLAPTLSKQLKEIQSDDLYPTTTDPLDVQGQIDELVNLVQTLGFERVLVTTDLHTREITAHLPDLQELFEWLELTHHPKFVLVAAVPSEALEQGDIIRRARGRVSVVQLRWTLEQVQQIATRHIQRATNGSITSLTAVATPQLLEKAAVLIEEAYGYPSPAGWVAVAESLLYTLQTRHPPWNQLTETDFPAIEYAFFARHMPLTLDEAHHGVWRGPRFLRLDDQPMRLMTLLRQCAGVPLNPDDERLFSLAGSKENIHAIVSRVRKVIEPGTEQPVYLLNKRGVGYWLENYN